MKKRVVTAIGALTALWMIGAPASPATQQVKWWRYSNERFGIRFDFPAHWNVHEHAEATRLTVRVGPSGEDPPITLHIVPIGEAKNDDWLEKGLLAEPTTKVSIVEIAGERVRQLTYLEPKGGYHRSVQLTHQDRHLWFGCFLDLVPEADEAFDELLKSFRFTNQRHQ